MFRDSDEAAFKDWRAGVARSHALQREAEILGSLVGEPPADGEVVAGDLGDSDRLEVEVECGYQDGAGCKKCRKLSREVPVQRIASITAVESDYQRNSMSTRVVCRFLVRSYLD